MSRKTRIWIVLSLFTSFMPAAYGDDEMLRLLTSGDPSLSNQAIAQIRHQLQTMPAQAVDRLNESWMAALLDGGHFDAVNEFAMKGTFALPADTRRIEQLQKHRVRALIAQKRPTDAIKAAHSLFNVCGMAFVKEALALLVESVQASHPEHSSIPNLMKAQILAASQELPEERIRLTNKWGGLSVMNSFAPDEDAYRSVLAASREVRGYHGLCGLGNLLLMSGRLHEAREVFDKAAAVAPPEERVNVLETAARLMKAEDGGVGRANQYVRSLAEQP
jgi:hypothetical protein